jgi:hypothetical protein
MTAMFFDDFYPDPEGVRDIALSGVWHPSAGMFTGSVSRCDGFPMASVVERLALLMGVDLRFNSLRPAVFRSLTAAQYALKEKTVHVDRMGLAVVICLSEPDGPDSRTSFYRHIATGLTGTGDTRDVLRAAARMRQSPRTLRRQLDRDGSDVDKWERSFEIPYRFNRAIVFDSNRFHGAGGSWGETLETSKLTQNFNCWPYRRGRSWETLRRGVAVARGT